jgi:hypothetical protein
MHMHVRYLVLYMMLILVKALPPTKSTCNTGRICSQPCRDGTIRLKCFWDGSGAKSPL